MTEIRVPSGIYHGKTLAEVALDPHGMQWLRTRLRRPLHNKVSGAPVDADTAAFAAALSEYVERHQPELWAEHQQWMNDELARLTDTEETP